MSKKKRPAQGKPTPPPTQQTPPTSKTPPPPSIAPVKRADNAWLIWLGVGMLVVLLVGGAVAWLSNRSVAVPSASASTPTPQRRTNMGRVTACQKNPNFSQSVGLGKRVVASTSTRGYKGIILFDANNPQNVYQHPSWDDLGALGQFVADKDGNIYVLPAMEISISGPPDLQSKIFKVDTNQGELKEFMAVPAAGGLSPENPFGVLSLTYDCDSNSLYAATVGGSTSDKEIGRIFRIDLNTGKVVSQFENRDIVGLGIFNGAFGKRMYYGSARTPEVYSIQLSNKGDFVGEPRLEFILSELPGGSDDKARRLLFTDNRELNVRAWPFDFNLRAASETPKRVYHFKYREQDDTWQFVNAEAIEEGQ